MKVKTFILSLLLTMFCSTSFGQHWGEIPNDFDGNMTFVTQIFINGDLQGNDIEIGAFCGNEFRGSARPITDQANLVYLLIGGDADHNGDQISFKLARHYADRPSEELDYVVLNAVQYDNNARIGGSPSELVNGLLPEDYRTEFNSVARLTVNGLNGKVYPSLANALAACTAGDNTIELLKDNAEDVTIKQVEGVNVTIDGGTSRYDYSGTITIHGNHRYAGAETLTFKNIDFVTSEASHYFIDSNSTDSDERYAHNVTVDDCNFTATDAGVNSAVAMRIRQGFDIAINGGTFTGLHSVLQAYGNAGINITGIESNCKNGISVGSSTGVVIENSNITATGYGLRADGTGAYDMTLKGANSITAELPVVVRNTTGAYKLTVESGTYTALNGNPAVTFTTGDDGTFVAPTADATATIADGVNVTTFGLEAKIANDYYTIVANAATAASNETGDQTIVLIKDATSTVNPLNVEILDLNAKTLTANVIGKVKTNGGLWITPENFKMIGVGADYYTTDNATIVMGANYALRMTEGTVTLAQSWRTLPGQTVAIESYAKFIVPAGMTYQIYGTAVAAAGTLEVNGTVQLAQLDATLTAEAGLNVVSGVDDYVVKYENGVYKLGAGNVLNVNTGKKYDKISSAIADATADNKLQLLQDITEDVTITKNITLDGAGKNYTGKITLNKVNFTVENVNFVKGNIYKNKNTGVGGIYTIKNCTFDGQSMNDYAVNLGGTSAIVIEGVTAKDYGYGFLQVPASNTSVSVKDVEISNVNYGLKIDYSGGVTLENVKAVASVAGVLNSNFGAKTITIKNSELSILGTWERGTNLTTTYLFEGNNTIGQFDTEDALDIFKLTKTDATLTAPEGKTVTTDISGYVVKYEDGKYIVVGANVQVKDGDEVKGTFATLAEAITAAQAGNTIVLLANITEDVTVNKSVTIDGANKNYTGTMNVNTSLTVTVQNVNFVKGCIDKTEGTSGTLTVKDCTFDGVDESINYAVTMRGGNSVTIEGGEVKNYDYGMLYVPSAVSNVTVKGTKVDGVNYGVHVAYGSKVNIENVTMTNMAYGIMTQNYGAKTITIKNSNISGTNPIYVWERNTTVVDTFKFEGANTFSGLTSSKQAKLVLAAADATLTAPAGYNVTTIPNYVVVYEDGMYKVKPAVASITADGTTTYYETLAGAVEAATAGQTVNLLKAATGAGLKINKDVTIDLGDFTYTINEAVGSTGTESQGFQLLKDNEVTIKNGNIAVVDGTHVVWMFNSYADLTLENVAVNCTKMDLADPQKKYVVVANNGGGATPTVTMTNVTVSGFEETTYGAPYYVDPGTTLEAPANLNVETMDGYVVVYNGTSYTAVAANVQVKRGEEVIGTYATLQSAINAAANGDEIDIIADHELTWDGTTMSAGGTYAVYALVENKTLTIDLNGKIITVDTDKYTGSYEFGIIAAGDKGILTLTDSSAEGTGAINATGTKGCVLLWSRGGTSKFTINAGNYYLQNAAEEQSMVYAGNNEIVVVNGGKFILGNVGTGANGSPWIFNVSGQNERHVTVNGGTFNADIVHQYYCFEVDVPKEKALRNNGDGTWTIVEAVAYVEEKEGVYVNEVGYETVAEAYDAAESGETITLLKDVTCAGLSINKDVTIDLGGFTYTINEAVGSTGTESQGFQLLKNNTVTLKNGTIAIAENTNVKWMFNAYADVTLENLNVNCANMAAPAENEANYVLVVNNGGSATPTVTYTNVNVTNFPSTATAQIWLDPTTTLKAGADLESSIETVEGYVVVYNNGEYTAIGAVAKIGEAIYPSVAAAVAAAQAGDVIELLVNVTEDVTVNKSVTIDGANKNYTGNISVSGTSTAITVKNVNFVNGTGYAITTNRIKSVTVEDCTVTDYGFGFLYANKSTPTVVVKNVTVEGGNYGFHWVYGTTATLENVTMTDVTIGLYIQNYAGKTINVKNSTISSIAIWERSGYSGVQTFKFEGANTVGTLTDSQYAKYVLTTTGTTLTAPAGFNVTTSVADHIVDYADGKYYLRVPNYVAAIGETKYESLQAAIGAAQNGDVIEVIGDINVGKDDVVILEDANGRDKYNTFFKVEGKAITINLNGHNITGDVLDIQPLGGFGLIAIFSIQEGGNLTLNDNGNTSTVKIDNSTVNNVYSLISCYDNGNGSKLTINGGNYYLNKAVDCLIHSAGDEAVTVNGGTFTLVNVGEEGPSQNYNPWIFNANGNNQRNVIVNGGTFNADVNHQHWAHEVYVPNTLALKDNGNGTWTVVDAVAQGTDSWRGYNRSLGYASIADAAHWATAETTVTVVADHAATVPAVVERNLTLDMNAKAVTAQDIYPVIRIQNGANVTVTGAGSITNNDYVFVLGASDGTSVGNLTIENGTFHGATTVASVTKGNLIITGGDFSVEPYEGSYAFLINCIDANYEDGLATVSISGGTFHNWNPENNAAEGANTNFCAQGYGAVKNPTDDVWTVVPKQTAEVKDGWNWFSYYVEGNVLNQLQNSLGTVGVQIKSREAYTQYSNGYWNGGLQSTTPAESYKINVNADTEINVKGNIVDPSTCYIKLYNGSNNNNNNGAWNWIGYPLAQETSVETAFENVVDDGDEIKTRTGFAEYVGGRWWGSLMTLEPGVGYMYFRARTNVTVSDFTYPTPSSKEAVQPNITADANLWVPNSTSYANNMTMVAVLNMNGEMMNDNYEVAAMVNGEVRGSARPIYVEPMDAYMLFLTIHGEGVEEVTFQCYDFNTDTEYVLNNTINYSDDARLGSVNEPYVLCYGTMGIGENAMNTINIYPNPTTTGREINLGATCDKVEVYNALGVKVAEYQNVDTLDAIETAGIYVIRVTNDGDVKHCRLVVK